MLSFKRRIEVYRKPMQAKIIRGNFHYVSISIYIKLRETTREYTQSVSIKCYIYVIKSGN